MIDTFLQDGTEIAEELRDSSGHDTPLPVKTTGDLLAILAEKPPISFPMLKTTCGHLGTYLGMPGDQITFDMLSVRRKGLRAFLSSRKYAENSIRSYVYYTGILMKMARRHGWQPDASASEDWLRLLALAHEKKITDIVRHFSQVTKSPAEVTAEDIEHWYKEVTAGGMLFTTAAAKRNTFLRLLRDTGWTTYNPPYLIKQSKYGIPLDQLAPELSSEIEAVVKWKTAEYSRDRPKWGKIRAITARKLKLTFTQIAGYAINILGIQPTSLMDLIEKDVIEGYVEWAINERGNKGAGLQSRLGSVASVMCHHREYAGHDFKWMKSLIDSIALEDESERKQRKSQKFIDYDVLETIPDKIRSARQAYAKKKKRNAKRIARMAMEELMFLWFLMFPWRQRNLREIRIDGPSPNLFKGRIAPFSELDRPEWVVEEEARDPSAEFWQAKFSPKETKTKLPIHLILPRRLIGPLDEYLTEYRPILLDGKRTETLFLNQVGKPIRADLVDKVIGHWSLQATGVRTTPHLFRDSLAYMWLKTHPKDYLTLAKLLWHKNLETTVGIYGSRYNESSAACAMEAWREQRAAEAKAQ